MFIHLIIGLFVAYKTNYCKQQKSKINLTHLKGHENMLGFQNNGI